MPRGKPSKPAPSPKLSNFEAFLDSYDYKTLVGALNSFSGSTGWELLRAYLEKQAAYHARQSIMFAQEDGFATRAASAGAKAEILQQVADQFLTELTNTVLNKTQAVTDPPTDPEVLDHPVETY